MIQHDTKAWFHEGRGNVSSKVAKSGSEIVSQESATEQGGMEGVPAKKPVYATGDSPFHEGRGSGRGNS